MNVLIVTEQVVPHEGGLSTHVTDLIAGLRGAGHRVELVHSGQVTMSRGSRWIHGALALGNRDRYLCRRMRELLGALSRLVSAAIDKMRPDVIHSHDAYAGYAIAQAVPATGIPVVQTVHGPALYEFRQLHREQPLQRFEQLILTCERTAFVAASRAIAVDSGQAAILRDDYSVPPDRISVIFNSVNVDALRRLTQTKPATEQAQPYFLVPRRLVPKTGVRFAVEALAKMSDQGAQLVIAGDGPLRKELQELAATLGVSARVRFLGSVPRPTLIPFFARACGVLIPSVPTTGVIEATSLAVMEAMACGSVPIASAIGGLAELIADDQTGLLVPPADAAALAAAMESLLRDPLRRERLVRGATAKVKSDYDTSAWLARVVRVYEAVRQHSTPTAAPRS